VSFAVIDDTNVQEVSRAAMDKNERLLMEKCGFFTCLKK
jgi:hypothetical protein